MPKEGSATARKFRAMPDRNPFADWLSSNPFSGSWLTVAQSRAALIGPPFVNACLAQLDERQDAAALLDSTASPVHGLGEMYGEPAQDDGSAPEFVASSRSGSGVRFWPFARSVERPGGATQLEPFQPLLAHHAAWDDHTRNERRWYRLHEGEPQLIVRWTPDPDDPAYAGTLGIYRPALLKYLHDMNLHLALFFDVRAVGDGVPNDWRGEHRDDRRHWRAWNTSADQLLDAHAQAMMLGVEILVRPEEDPEPGEDRQASVEFPIGLDADTGKPVSVSYPGLPNNRTAWPGAGNDNFLTHLFFRAQVLERYHADTTLYTVSPGYVRAWSGWGLQVGLTEQGNLHAYLGDVAKLPRYEQEHWARYAVVDDKIPESRARADFLGEFVDGPTHRTVIDDLRRAHAELNEAFRVLHGPPLLPAVEAINEPKVNGLRVPRNEVTSFQAQLTALSLLIGDSLDSKALTTAGAPKIDGAGTLQRLEVLLEQLTGRGDGGVREDIAALFEVQTLRSRLGGVHDASDAEKTLARYNAGGLPWDDWFTDLVERVTAALQFVAIVFAAADVTSGQELG